MLLAALLLSDGLTWQKEFETHILALCQPIKTATTCGSLGQILANQSAVADKISHTNVHSLRHVLQTSMCTVDSMGRKDKR